jgi:hypothetical protein
MAENFLTGIQQKSFTYAINKPIIIITVAGGSGRQRGFSIPCLSDDEGFVRGHKLLFDEIMMMMPANS